MKRNTYWLRVALFLVLASVMLIGCQKYNEEEDGGSAKGAENDNTSQSSEGAENANFDNNVFNFATNQDIPNLDPHGSPVNAAFRVLYLMYDRLITFEGTSTEPQPMLAESWDISDDGLEYTFHLVENATFHDGTPVTAEAVQYSFTRAIKIGKSASGIFKNIIDENSFEIINDHTIKITLKEPFAPFISTLGTAYASIINPNLAENEGSDSGESYVADKDLGSGAYMLESWDRGQSLVIKPNPDYWNADISPSIDTVNIQFITESSSARLMLEKGEVDMLDYSIISPEVLGQMEGTAGVKIDKATSYQIDYMSINTEKSEALANEKVRQAIAHSINYDALHESVYLGEAGRIGGGVPSGMFGYNPDAKLYDYDLDKAKQLLEEAGYGDGLSLEIAISENHEVRNNTSLLLQSDFSKVGIDLEIKTYAWPTFLDLIQNGGHDLALLSWTPDYPDPDYNLWYFAHSSSKGPGFNVAFYENKEVDSLMEEARVSTDETKREENYVKIQGIMAEEVPYVFIAEPNIQVPMRDWVKGFEINPMNTWYVPFHNITKE